MRRHTVAKVLIYGAFTFVTSVALVYAMEYFLPSYTQVASAVWLICLCVGAVLLFHPKKEPPHKEN